MAQIMQLDGSLHRAQNLYDDSTRKLRVIEHNLKINKVALHAARKNLRLSQHALMQRLVTIYTSRDDQSTLAVMLGAKSIDDLVNRIEAVQSVSSQDVAVMNEVIAFKKAVVVHQRALVTAHRSQAHLVAAAGGREGAHHARSSAVRSGCYASVKGEIERLIQADHARQLALAKAATARYDASQQQQALALQQTAIGASASTGDVSVAPPSQYTRRRRHRDAVPRRPVCLGRRSSPSGFDCSGFVAYVYAQVGVSLPHYTGAQWNVGVPVSRSDLEPGDLVFFDGLGHVGIYIGGNEFIHAPHTGDVVKISSITGWYADTYVGARRITG